MQIASRMDDIPLSSIRKVFDRANRLIAQGREVIHLTSGLPDFDTPAHIKAAAVEALDRGEVKYTANRGIPRLLEAISTKLEQDNGLVYDPQSEICVTVGVAEALIMSFMAVLNPGDEVIAPSPYFPFYRYAARMSEARLVEVPLRAENGFQPDPADLEAAITPRTRMIIATSPHNPTGAVWSAESMNGIADLAIKHDLVAVSDEIYEKCIYAGRQHISLAALEGMRQRTITLNGFSKSYAMTGWRLGYAAAPAELMSAMARIHAAVTVCAASFSQWAGVAALTGPQDEITAMVTEFDRRRKMVIDRLSAMPGLEVAPAEGAFYVFPKLQGLDMDSSALAEKLLMEGGAAVVPWGPDNFRVSYANSFENLSRAMDNVAGVMASL